MAILITRPLPFAKNTADVLENLGFNVLSLPLTKTMGLHILATQYQTLIVPSTKIIASSAATFHHLPPHILKDIKHKPLYCIGEKTATAAKACGMSNSIAYYENGQDFMQRANISAESSIVYLIGKRHIDVFVQKLQKKFKHLNVLEIYDTKSIKLSAKDLAQLPKTIEVIMLYSALAAENIQQLQKHIHKDTVFLCLSERIAKALPKNLNNKIIIAKKPNEQSMIDALQNR